MFKVDPDYEHYIKNASLQELKHLDILSQFSPSNNDASHYIEEQDISSQLDYIKMNFGYLSADESSYYQEIMDQRYYKAYYSLTGGLSLSVFYFMISKEINRVRGSIFLRFF